MFDIQKMMKQAQKMQEKMQEMDQELQGIEVQGSAGGDAVVITCTGKLEFRAVKIRPDALGDAEMLEDLVLTALKDASQKVNELRERKIGEITGGMNIPGLKLPF